MPPLPTPADLKKLHSFNQLLELFHAATKQLEGDHLTLPQVPSVLHRLKTELQDAASDKDQVTRSQCAQLFLRAFENRFGFIFSQINLALQAAALHPSFGHLPWVSSELRDAIWVSLKKLGDSLCSPEEGKVSMSVKSFLKAIKSLRRNLGVRSTTLLYGGNLSLHLSVSSLWCGICGPSLHHQQVLSGSSLILGTFLPGHLNDHLLHFNALHSFVIIRSSLHMIFSSSWLL